MIIGDRFPVRNKHFGKNIRFDLSIYFQTDPVGSIVGNLADDDIAYGKTNHCAEGLKQTAGLMSGDDVDKITGDKTAAKSDNGSKETEYRIKDHCKPVTSGVLVNPFCLKQHVF